MPSLKIDLNVGVLEAEGSESFLREILGEFQKLGIQARNPMPTHAGPHLNEDEEPENQAADKKPPKRRAKRKVQKEAETGAVSNYSPSVKKSLNLNGIVDFVAPYKLSTHPEKILAFSMFLREKKGINPIEADDIFTAYRFANMKPAKAFLQSIRDSSHKKTWLDYQSPTSITITPLGETHFLHDLEKKPNT